MRFFGVLTYNWRGVVTTAIATTAPAAPGSRMPAVVIGLHDEWVTVGRPAGGTQLVAWESIRSISGWSPLPTGANG